MNTQKMLAVLLALASTVVVNGAGMAARVTGRCAPMMARPVAHVPFARMAIQPARMHSNSNNAVVCPKISAQERLNAARDNYECLSHKAVSKSYFPNEAEIERDGQALREAYNAYWKARFEERQLRIKKS